MSLNQRVTAEFSTCTRAKGSEVACLDTEPETMAAAPYLSQAWLRGVRKTLLCHGRPSGLS
jgi:hypothetical protein